MTTKVLHEMSLDTLLVVIETLGEASTVSTVSGVCVDLLVHVNRFADGLAVQLSSNVSDSSSVPLPLMFTSTGAI